MSIQVNQLTKIYEQQKAVDDVSFEIQSGEIVGLLGPNGAGKSTLMKILSGFIPQTSGSAMVCGLDVKEQSLEVRKKVGYLPENNPLYIDMYVREYLEFIGGIHKIGKQTKARVNELIELTGLTLEQKKKIGQLSKGYRQRVGLAQAMFHNPEVLILDEPTSGLDPNQLVEVRNLIKTIGETKTVLLSTHIMQEVEAMCSKVLIINHGKIVAFEPTSNLQQTSTSLQSVVIEFSTAVDQALFSSIPHLTDIKQVANNCWELQSNQEGDLRETLFRFAVEHSLTVLSMQLKKHSMEEVFHTLTKE